MNKHVRKGSTQWTYEFNVGMQSWEVFAVKVIRKSTDAYVYPHHVIVRLYGKQEEEDCLSRKLFHTEEEATEALRQELCETREQYKRDLMEYTKRIAVCWKHVDFCTDVIEQLTKETT